jgi:hypothetical protein
MEESVKRHILESLREKYHRARRKAKSALLREVENLLGCHRKHSIPVMKKGPPGRKPHGQKRGRKSKYDAARPSNIYLLSATCSFGARTITNPPPSAVEYFGGPVRTLCSILYPGAASRMSLSRATRLSRRAPWTNSTLYFDGRDTGGSRVTTNPAPSPEVYVSGPVRVIEVIFELGLAAITEESSRCSTRPSADGISAKTSPPANFVTTADDSLGGDFEQPQPIDAPARDNAAHAAPDRN